VPGLRAFTGTSVRGTWRLRVVDTWFWDTGKIRAFRLVARTTVPAPTTVQPTARRRKARPRRAGAPAARA
jgi:subtilisin-like proprotein convertase family protein